jgi:hypothetical protein
MTVSGKFLPSDTHPGQWTEGVPTSKMISEKEDMGKFLPGGEKRFVKGSDSELPEKGEMGRFLPRGQKRMVKGI